MSDLFDSDKSGGKKVPGGRKGATPEYGAQDIEVLEGLEPVRRRPGMYIGGTDDNAYHHLASEILDNAMDEAVAGHATSIEMRLEGSRTLMVRDNGRGIPTDPHPKFPDKSALEVIFTTLHAGGKFSGKAYDTSGGLHGVGSSVVNALSEKLEVEVARDRLLYRQDFARGIPLGPLAEIGNAPNRRGTTVRFTPDPEIFGSQHFSAARLYRLCCSKAALFRGVAIQWKCEASLIKAGDETPTEALIQFPNGLEDALTAELGEKPDLLSPLWAGEAELPLAADGRTGGKVEWAVAFLESGNATLSSYCNTIPTPQGGTHEAGFRAALVKGFRAWGDQRKVKRAAAITAEDVMGAIAAKLSVFIREPQFQGQTKDRLTTQEATRLVEGALRDRIDHWLGGNPQQADNLLTFIVERAEERLRRRESKDTARKSATRKLRLPGKLTDCTRENASETEIFLVEGESAGGSARQARDRETQAVLPLRGKILNVASATVDKMRANQELRDLTEALGCGVGSTFDVSKLRYGRVIIMTDADVDGAHIASLLMTFFYREMPDLIRHGHLHLAQPPLYRLTHGAKTVYAMNDQDRERRIKTEFKANAKVEVSRFKGLGEMPVTDLKQTTMDPARRTLLRVVALPEDRHTTNERVESLMGRKPELRFRFIQEHARSVEDLDV
ncbi:DNA topoisomerase IV subunit B [Gluconobacter wancherniae]|uniref:DNA topoisomerase 4 subunit B n=1 Tax=Gluconobacter wancherniae NBRC 103581 TaxID=656744 RepID=A0A511B019_9PROT|nr:DNA topoisomerase IV subunit B [Gluconobacter wancherniae]MBF0854377.1 DNA topoisomerase IV subunit B [Gluconobacter wancherniae]MBS1062773.1 DNA topoisomerase IV subunit B [Gluconobacter wancherniae]MBS1088491.1 DNA topoisomerase IV subunit B [Gluconobacter wancherniae]GBD57438.1 DNA topoisomerase 4 subunit B [Gluconobacter wancherniae NBRC 103581]GBR62660.1 DNA topoisomerase IV subunit B [Gluconobacter wancherniae NBRC 103581]